MSQSIRSSADRGRFGRVLSAPFCGSVAGGYNTRAVGMSLGAEGLAAPVLSADFKPQGGELALAKLIEAGYFDTLVN